MAVWVCLGALAAYGLLCALWATLGWLLSGGAGGATVCLCRPGGRETGFIRRCLWLQGLGILRGPVLLVDGGLAPQERESLKNLGSGIEFCGLEELASRLEVERRRLDGTGT